MEEEDGSPGARAIHFGPTGAPYGAPTDPLHSTNLGAPGLDSVTWEGSQHPAPLVQNEENNENVPGK
jgi:hypothetical protein